MRVFSTTFRLFCLDVLRTGGDYAVACSSRPTGHRSGGRFDGLLHVEQQVIDGVDAENSLRDLIAVAVEKQQCWGDLDPVTVAEVFRHFAMALEIGNRFAQIDR